MSYQRSFCQTTLDELFPEYTISLTANRGVNRETSSWSLHQERPVVLKPSGDGFSSQYIVPSFFFPLLPHFLQVK